MTSCLATPDITHLDCQDEVERLNAFVRFRLHGRLRDFRLRVRSRGLILQGSARSYYVKQLAQHAVMEATQLPIAANEIEVC